MTQKDSIGSGLLDLNVLVILFAAVESLLLRRKQVTNAFNRKTNRFKIITLQDFKSSLDINLLFAN